MCSVSGSSFVSVILCLRARYYGQASRSVLDHRFSKCKVQSPQCPIQIRCIYLPWFLATTRAHSICFLFEEARFRSYFCRNSNNQENMLLQMSITHHTHYFRTIRVCKGPGQQYWLSLPRDSTSLASMPYHLTNPCNSLNPVCPPCSAQVSHELRWQEWSSEFVCPACTKCASMRLPD